MDFIFDLDGTLIDSAPAIRHCLRAATATVAPEFTERAATVPIGPPLPAMVEWILGRADDARGPDLLAAFKRRYDTEGVALTQAFPGASEVLAVLAARSSQLTIVSNKRALPTARILDALGWTTYFGAVRCSDSKGCAGLDKIARVAALRPALGECVLVGDTREDYHAASRNGIAFIAADYGYETDPAAFAALAAFKRMAAPQELAELADLKR